MKKFLGNILFVVLGVSYFVVMGFLGLVVNYILMIYSSVSVMIISLKDRKNEWTLLEYFDETIRYFFATQRNIGIYTFSEKCTEEFLSFED